MPIYYRCSSCGKRLLKGEKCSCIKERYKRYNHERKDSKEDKFYFTSEWDIKRTKIKNKFKGLDIYSYYINGVTEYGKIVHHIVEVKEDWSKRLDDDNLILLTDSNHKKIHKMMLKSSKDKIYIQEQLKKIVKKYEEEIMKEI